MAVHLVGGEVGGMGGEGGGGGGRRVVGRALGVGHHLLVLLLPVQLALS